MDRKQDPSTHTNCCRRICHWIVLSARCVSQCEELGADTGTSSNNIYYIGRAPFSGQDPNLLADLKACSEFISPWNRMNMWNKYIQKCLLNQILVPMPKLITEFSSGVLSKYIHRTSLQICEDSSERAKELRNRLLFPVTAIPRPGD